MIELGEVLAEEDVTEESPQEEAEASAEIDLSELTFAEKLALLRPRFRLTQVFIVDSDFGKQEVNTYITAMRGELRMPLSHTFGIRLIADGQISNYDFSGSNDFLYTGRATGEPFDELIANVYRLEGMYQWNEEFRLFGGVFVRSRFERGVSYGDGIEGGGFAGFRYVWRDLTVVLGVGMGSRMDKDDPSVSPIFQLAWQITDDTDVQTEGLGFRIGTRFSDQFSGSLSVGFQGSRYRLKNRSGLSDRDDPTSGPVKKGTLRDRRLHLVTGLTWRPNRTWRVRASVGMVPYQQYTSKNHRGNTVDKSAINNPAFASVLSAEYRF